VLNTLFTGITAGAAYGLIAVSLVLVFKATRTFNFAQAEIGTVAGYAAFAVSTHTGLPYVFAFAAGVLTGVVMGVLMERLVIRPLARARRVTVLVATAAIATSIIGLETLFVGDMVRMLPPLVTWSGLKIGTYVLSGSHVAALATVLVLAVAGSLFFSRTLIGAAIVAASEEPTGARIIGIPVSAVSVIVWGMAGGLAAIAGLLLAPLQSLSPGWLTANGLLGAFAAMVIGGMTSIAGALIGGIVVGIVEAMAFAFVGAAVPGASSLAVLVALTAVLVLRPEGLLSGAMRRA
jgi:branched-chain amino acid transport system permease protein